MVYQSVFFFIIFIRFLSRSPTKAPLINICTRKENSKEKRYTIQIIFDIKPQLTFAELISRRCSALGHAMIVFVGHLLRLLSSKMGREQNSVKINSQIKLQHEKHNPWKLSSSVACGKLIQNYTLQVTYSGGFSAVLLIRFRYLGAPELPPNFLSKTDLKRNQ